jgi:hypothetical protein
MGIGPALVPADPVEIADVIDVALLRQVAARRMDPPRANARKNRTSSQFMEWFIFAPCRCIILVFIIKNASHRVPIGGFFGALPLGGSSIFEPVGQFDFRVG